MVTFDRKNRANWLNSVENPKVGLTAKTLMLNVLVLLSFAVTADASEFVFPNMISQK